MAAAARDIVGAEPPVAADSLTGMDARDAPTWLVVNEDSGSNDPDSVAALRDQLAAARMPVVRDVCFPTDELPTPQALDAAGVGIVAIFTGDGSINALVTALDGWGGRILVLPGGTMNLLSKRLHGDAGAEVIVARVADGDCTDTRPTIVGTDFGPGLSGVLVGPGTVWNEVREAMRDFDPAGIVGGTAHGLAESVSGPMVHCAEPGLGRAEGYPLLLLSPVEDGFTVLAYHAESAGEYAAQALALLKRDFREGPHDDLGTVRRLTIASTDGSPIGVLVDGEPAECSGRERFVLARAGVDLVATRG